MTRSQRHGRQQPQRHDRHLRWSARSRHNNWSRQLARKRKLARGLLATLGERRGDGNLPLHGRNRPTLDRDISHRRPKHTLPRSPPEQFAVAAGIPYPGSTLLEHKLGRSKDIAREDHRLPTPRTTTHTNDNSRRPTHAEDDRHGGTDRPSSNTHPSTSNYNASHSHRLPVPPTHHS